jgi:hypothetical protein
MVLKNNFYLVAEATTKKDGSSFSNQIQPSQGNDINLSSMATDPIAEQRWVHAWCRVVLWDQRFIGRIFPQFGCPDDFGIAMIRRCWPSRPRDSSSDFLHLSTARTI